jgi:uncharacterized membrane protein YtjA (UPF0391 family)
MHRGGAHNGEFQARRWRTERKRLPAVIELEPEATMLRFAILFLIISLIAGALGLVNISTVARRISMALFAVFFLMAAALFGMVALVGEALVH